MNSSPRFEKLEKTARILILTIFGLIITIATIFAGIFSHYDWVFIGIDQVNNTNYVDARIALIKGYEEQNPERPGEPRESQLYFHTSPNDPSSTKVLFFNFGLEGQLTFTWNCDQTLNCSPPKFIKHQQ